MFVAVMETGSFARTAERLRTSPGQASKLISGLESDLGVQLLNRTMLIDFARQFPQIELDVSFSDRVVSLVDEGIDVAIRIGSPADSRLIARHRCQARIVV